MSMSSLKYPAVSECSSWGTYSLGLEIPLMKSGKLGPDDSWVLNLSTVLLLLLSALFLKFELCLSWINLTALHCWETVNRTLKALRCSMPAARNVLWRRYHGQYMCTFQVRCLWQLRWLNVTNTRSRVIMVVVNIFHQLRVVPEIQT